MSSIVFCADNMEAAGINSNGRHSSRSRGRKKSNSGGGGLYKNYQKSMAASDMRENGSRSR